jgi:hypothetical protein
MSRKDVALQLVWSTSTIFRIETGQSPPGLYGVTGPERDGLI